jgi:hypothetical protein
MDAQSFAYWYITLFLLVLGLAATLGFRYLGDLKRTFRYELRDPVAGERLKRVLERRQELEGLGGRQILIGGICYIFFGALCGLRVVTPGVAYALACVDSALVLAVSFSSIRNTSERRAASLSPRTQTTAVPMFGYFGAAVAACLPLTLVANRHIQLAAILVSAASFTILIAAWFSSSMAAILIGDDVDLELYVDERVRRARVCSMLSLAYAVVPVFFAIATPAAMNSPLYYADVLGSVALAAAYFVWYGIDRWRGRLPRQVNGAHA